MADQNQLSRDILRIAIEQNIQIVDADQSQSSNQQQNDDAMEAIIFFEKELGILPKNNPEAIPAPPTQNPNSVKPEDAKVNGAKWANLFDDEVPTTSSHQTNNIPNIAENCPSSTRNFSGNTIDVSNHSVNGIETEVPEQESVPPEETSEELLEETPSNTPEATAEEAKQEMLNPHFEPQQFVVKDKETALHTIKINQLVQVTILPNCVEEENVLVGIYHSHPEYVAKTISGVDSSQPTIANGTPFSVFNINEVLYTDVKIPFMKMSLKGALIKVEKGINKIPLKFHLTSSNSNNHGDVKLAKEWHLLVVPVSKKRAQNIRSSFQPTELSQDECIPLSKLRIQVCKEARGNKVLKKAHRNIEVPWPIHISIKRQRLEQKYIEAKKRKLLSMTDEELQRKIAKSS